MRPRTILRYLILLLFFLYSAYPLLWMFLCACRMEGEAQARPLALPQFWTFDNFLAVFRNPHFGRA